MVVIFQKYAPHLYHWFIRPTALTKKYIHQLLQQHFQFDEKIVLDFGSGTGANSVIFAPENYMGIDPDQQRISFAKKRYPAYTFFTLQNQRLPIETNSTHHVLIIAVLHHISSPEITNYLQEFKRILKPGGSIIALEPYLDTKTPFCNRFMQWFDKGNYIRSEQEYLQLFEKNDCQCVILDKFSKCFLYNELLFTAQFT